MRASFRVDGVQDAELYTTALALKNLRIARRRGSLPSPFGSGVVYRREKGDNLFKTFVDCLRDGFADCEDLVAWLVSWCWFRGLPARVRAVRTGPKMLHLVAVVNGRVVDPSRLLGMK